MTLQESDEEINRKVATLCGRFDTPTTKPTIAELEAMINSTENLKVTIMPDGQVRAIPDYCNDLNACVEFEKGLTDEEMCNNYAVNLGYQVLAGATPETKPWRIWHATARQRAEAFLKTMESKL